MKKLVTLIFLCLTLISYSNQKKNSADIIYQNGKIYTVNEAQPWAEAVAIKDNKFLMVGSNQEIEAVKSSDTKVIDLAGKFVMPGFFDTHVHIEQAYIADLVGEKLLTFSGNEKSIKELQEKLKAYAENNKELDILFAQNLLQDIFPNSSPTKKFIDEVVSDKPVFILSDTEHEGLLNSAALNFEGITAETQNPEGGEIDRFENGEPTGYLREKAAGKWAWKHYPSPSIEEHTKGLQATIAYLNSIGVTSVKQQHAKNPIALAAQKLEKEGNLNVRIALSWTWQGPLEPMSLDEQQIMIDKRKQFSSPLIITEYVKLSLDGNVGTTGYVIEPYLLSDSRGLPVYPNNEVLYAQVEKFDQMGLGITAHATGDAASRQLIAALQKIKEEYGKLNARHQIAHASLIHPDDYSLIKDLDLTIEFSPVVWFPAPYPSAVAPQLGIDRMNRWFPMESVNKNGGRISIASDGPLMWQDTFSRLEGAITRKQPNNGEEALAPEEAISLETAIKAMTINSAYVLDLDKESGSIERGKYADMIILDQNLFEIKPEDISTTKVLYTLLNGQTVFDYSNELVNENMIEKKYNVDLDFSGEQGHPGCEH